jgi:molybdopterin-guanine dinucleotide biosynthesis protein A
MSDQNKVSGVVLAGGQARRMQQQDKGLVLFKQRPLVSYPIEALAAVADDLLISANRNQAIYQQWQYPVISDATDDFDGPLAGILAAMDYVDAEILLVLPCDSPLFTAQHLQQLLAGLTEQFDIAVADDGERLHPVFLAIRTELKASLKAYLANGERRLQNWIFQHRVNQVDFSQQAQIFTNVNTLAELEMLEAESKPL